MPTPLRIATRSSPLALAQASAVASQLARADHDLEVTLVEISTEGDRTVDVPLSVLGGQGIFVKEVQRAVLDGRADLAVHSAKDLPSVVPDGLVIAGVPSRADVRDVLCGRALAGLGPGATVATGAPRRRAQLLAIRPDLNVIELRGNIATRLGRLGDRGVDAIVMAKAALDRLGLGDAIAEVLEPSVMVPQVGQGALAIECRRDDEDIAARLASITDHRSAVTLVAERAMLATLGGGCTVPVGGHATFDGDVISLVALLCAPDGSQMVRVERSIAVSGVDAERAGESLGTSVGEELISSRQGATLLSSLGLEAGGAGS